jgi:purine-binding chemotaxis protein CheW
MALSNETALSSHNEQKLFSTFIIVDRLYGIDVTRVQEVTKALPCTRVPGAPRYLKGLINLRGQIATAIDLRELFDLPSSTEEVEKMCVFCDLNGALIALIVDKIGDVMEVDSTSYEETPDTIPEKVQKLMNGVYKIPNDLLSALDIDKIALIIN